MQRRFLCVEAEMETAAGHTYQGSSNHKLFSSTLKIEIAEARDNLANPGNLLDFLSVFSTLG